MPDYRNRPPVDEPRPTVRLILRSTPIVVSAGMVVLWAAIVGIGFLIAVACGLVG